MKISPLTWLRLATFGLAIALLLLTACSASLADHFLGRTQQLEREGDRLAAQGRDSEALLAYYQATLADAHNLAAQGKLASAYETQGRLRQAARTLQQALEIAPGDAALGAQLSALSSRLNTLSPSAPKPLWVNVLPITLPIGMALAGDRLIVDGEEGTVLALDLRTGSLLWRWQEESRLTTPPTATEGAVAVGGLADAAATPGQSGTLSLLDLRTGILCWRVETGSPIYGAPLISAAGVFAASSDGSLSAHARQDGSRLWEYKAKAALRGMPLLDSGVLYLGDGAGNFYALDAGSGAWRWKSETTAQGASEAQPVLSAGKVFFPANDGRLYVLDTLTGRRVWDFLTADAVHVPALVSEEKILLASSAGTLQALKPEDGSLLWEVGLDQPALAPLGAFPGYFLAAIRSDPNLYALSEADGKMLWQINAGDWLAQGPLVTEGKIYLLTKDGTVIAYQEPAPAP